jgi:hypothetical protein
MKNFTVVSDAPLRHFTCNKHLSIMSRFPTSLSLLFLLCGHWVLSVSAVGPPSSNYVQSGGSSSCVYKATGDPHFEGLLGQKFVYNGQPNRVFNLFSDMDVSVNARVHAFTTYHRDGTLMEALGFRLGRHHHLVVSVSDVDLPSKTLTLRLTDNNTTMEFSNPSKWATFDECARVEWEYPDLTIIYDRYQFTVTWSIWKYSGYYLDLSFSLPEQRRRDPTPNALGGVMGMTRSNHSTDNKGRIHSSLLVPSLYDEPMGLLGTTAKTNVWKASQATEYFTPESCPPSIDVALASPTRSYLSRGAPCIDDVPSLEAFPVSSQWICASYADVWINPNCAGCSGNAVCAYVTTQALQFTPDAFACLPASNASPVDAAAWSTACTCLNTALGFSKCGPYTGLYGERSQQSQVIPFNLDS